MQFNIIINEYDLGSEYDGFVKDQDRNSQDYSDFYLKIPVLFYQMENKAELIKLIKTDYFYIRLDINDIILDYVEGNKILKIKKIISLNKLNKNNDKDIQVCVLENQYKTNVREIITRDLECITYL